MVFDWPLPLAVLMAPINSATAPALSRAGLISRLKVAGASRSSKFSRHGWNRAGALRMVRGVREANSLRIQERMAMDSLLRDKAGPGCNEGTASPQPTERQAGKALTHAISQPPLLFLSSMRNPERNHATTCWAFSGRGTRRFGSGEGGRLPSSGLQPQYPGPDPAPPSNALRHATRRRARGSADATLLGRQALHFKVGVCRERVGW